MMGLFVVSLALGAAITAALLAFLIWAIVTQSTTAGGAPEHHLAEADLSLIDFELASLVEREQHVPRH